MVIMLMSKSLQGSLQSSVYKLLNFHAERGSDVVYAERLRVQISSKRRVGATKGKGHRPGARSLVPIDEMSMSTRNLAVHAQIEAYRARHPRVIRVRVLTRRVLRRTPLQARI
jgi:hypothetical protein